MKDFISIKINKGDLQFFVRLFALAGLFLPVFLLVANLSERGFVFNELFVWGACVFVSSYLVFIKTMSGYFDLKDELEQIKRVKQK